MPQHKDTDYLAISARLHAMENRLLTHERMERMIDAKDNSDAAKVLSECGYGELTQVNLAQLEGLLAKSRGELFYDMANAVPDERVIALFQLQYDYSNAKVMVKAASNGRDPLPLLVEGGRYAPLALWEGLPRDEYGDVSAQFKSAIVTAKSRLADTGDPQLVDFLLDEAQYREMTALAQGTESQFLMGYVRLMADSANLRTAVRCLRMGKGGDFLKSALVPGGNVSDSTIVSARSADLPSIFSGPLQEGARLGDALVQNGGSMTAFEKSCDDAVIGYLSTAKRVPFGVETVVGYLYARQAELTAIRTIMAGRLAGLDGDTIRTRLRQSYE